MTPEQKQQRIKEITERIYHLSHVTLHGPMPLETSMQLVTDAGFLLSLVKSQEADEGATRIERLEAQLQGVLNSLATSQREVERLRDGKFTAEEFQNLCHNLNGDDKTAFFDGCAKYQEQLFGVSAATSMRSACVEKLRDYRLKCEQTGVELSEKEDESSQRMYWRADGAADALEIVERELESLSIEKQSRSL